MPVGAVGEIWIGGAGLALGYAARPAVTAERFVPADGGGRWYRTGDLGRYDRTGRLRHLGRSDAQLKIRGHRVEPGEAEAALITHPAVSEAAVIARDGRLVGYFVPDPAADQALAPTVLKAHLSGLLPAYLIPDLLLPIAALPVTPHGKLDRSALAARPIRHATQSPDLGPRDGLEAVVIQTWSDILGHSVAAADDFFAAGGHSLDAARASTRLSAALGVEIPVLAVFEHPTPAALADWARARTAGPADPIPVLPGDGPFPLSSAQERLWFLAEYAPESPAYNVPIAARLTGPLDVPALRRALDMLAARHPALETVFESVNGHAVQWRLPTAETALTMLDLTTVPDAPRLAADLVDAEATRPFHLADGEPPFRATLIRVAEHEHVLVLLLHHIVADGWSVSVLARDLAAAYSGTDLSEPVLRHTDYAAWQRSRASRAAGQLTRRREELAGAPHTLELPADRPRPPERRHRGRTLPLEVDAGLTGRIRTLARESGATEFMVLLAAFAAALTRFSGQEDLLIGTPAANRTAPGAADVIGLFAETLVLRADTSGDPTVYELLARVRQACLDAYAAPDVAFETLVEAMAPQRDPARSPLFQVMIALNNAAGALPELPGLTAEPVAVPNRTAKFDVVLNLIDTADGIGGGLEFDTDVYQEPLMARFAEHFLRILRDFAEDPGRPLSAISALSRDEKQTWLRDFNLVPADYDPLTCLHTLVEAQAAATPDAVAVSMAAERGAPRPSLTYAELETRTNRLARHLLRRGVQPDDVVGVALPRGLDAVVAQYAVLKAGTGFLPLDPAQPPARLADILADAGARLVVTDSAGDGVLPAEPGRVHVDGPEWQAEDAGPVSAAVTPGHLPRRLHLRFDRKAQGRPDRAPCHLQQPAVDAAGLAAGRLRPDAAQDHHHLRRGGQGGVLAAAGRRRTGPGQARQSSATPNTWSNRSRTRGSPSPTSCPPCSNWPWRRWTRPAPGSRTRSATSCAVPRRCRSPPRRPSSPTAPPTCCTCTGRPRRPSPSPAGPASGPSPEAGSRSACRCRWSSCTSWTATAVRSRRACGESCTSAVRPSVAATWAGPRRPLARSSPTRCPDARARACIAPAMWSGTGPTVCWSSGAAPTNQIKIRGFRVELGEIEAALAAEPDVRQAAVVLRGRGADARLIGYAVPAPGESLDPEDLRRRLRGRLPDYMVPADIMVLTAMPLGDNAKVDPAALPEPAARRRTDPHGTA